MRPSMRTALMLTATLIAALGAAPALAAPDLATKLDQPQGKDFDAKLMWYAKHCLADGKALEAEGDAARRRGDMPAALGSYLAAIGESSVMTLGTSWEIEREASSGYRVKKVEPNLAAARAGIKVGDLIVAVDGMDVTSFGTFKMLHLMADLNTVPVRPFRLGVKREGALLELSMERTPASKWCSGDEDGQYRDALESKVVAFMLETGLHQEVNDNMRWAAGAIGRALRDAPDDAMRKEALGDLRATAVALVGWGDFYLNCGLLLESAGDATGAERCYRHFVQFKPEDPQAAAVAARFASLGPLVKLEADRKAFEGWWAAFRDGKRQDSGSLFKRNGAQITVTNLEGERWLRGTIVDEFHAEVVQTITAASVGGRLGGLITKCFGGTLEGAGTMTLSPDKQRMTMSVKNDIDVDANSCAIVRQNPAVTNYVR